MRTIYTNISDTCLWDHFRHGDDEAFALIYRSHVHALFDYGSRFSSDTEFVRDCIHDLFVELSNHRSTLGSTDNIRFYLVRSLKNKIVRQQKRVHDTVSIDDCFMLEAIPDVDREEKESLRVKKKLLRDTLNQMSERQKEIIYLRYIIELNNEEIAEVMGISYQAVRNTLYKALETLRKRISK
ncbi:MAG: sigma-70 family RNA polymerase sigma factor [Bacteroidales bacterium]|jgi:RNA polymerase sigma factor (sigma-70 family)|nr:sigma-70 family RNA polymerase sigma factor [Bacteroidales bacterium]